MAPAPTLPELARIFPILAAHSAFVRQPRRSWILERPRILQDSVLIDTAKQVYMEIADHNPQTMGKSKACYSSLMNITKIYAQVAHRMQ
jgi:hypothetical protein